jgi:hypothetical protein
MTYLVLAIAASTVHHVLFKAFARFRIDLLSAIVANYAVCVVIGWNAAAAPAFRAGLIAENWFPCSLAQGSLFVACLFAMGRTTGTHGVAAASLATRLSVAIPTLAAFLLYGDVVTTLKITGILVALAAWAVFDERLHRGMLSALAIGAGSIMLVHL